MEPEKKTPMEILPCGCRMGQDEVLGAFMFEPCALDCEMYLYVLEESKKQGKPITKIDIR